MIFQGLPLSRISHTDRTSESLLGHENMNQFDQAYSACLRQIMDNGFEELNERTGVRTRSLPGVHFAFVGGFPLLTLRKIPTKLFVAEQIWFLTGSRQPDYFLNNHTKVWNDFTNINGVVCAAYGYRWSHFFGRDQIQELIRLLETEPSSRHGLVVTWDPSSDGLNPVLRKKNVPCPFAFSANIMGGCLHFHNFVRSNDMILGFPHDVAGFALLHRMLAAHLGLEVGQYSHSIANAHIYEPHYAAAEQLMGRSGQCREIELTADKDWLMRARCGDDTLVEEIVGRIQDQYAPDSRIDGLQIVV